MANGLYAAIAQGGQPIQIENPINQMAKVMAIKNAQQEGQLNTLRLSEAERGAEEKAALRNYLSGVGDLSDPTVRSKLMTGFGLSGLDYSKALTEADKSRVQLQKDKFEIVKSKTNYYRDSLSGVNTPQDAQVWTAAIYADPDLGATVKAMGGDLQQALARIPTDPAAFDQWKKQTALGAQKFIELNAPKLTSQDTGGQSRILATPGLGGPSTVVPGSVAAKTLTPEQARTAGQERRVIAETITDAAGNVTALNKFGEVIQVKDAQGQPIAVKGKPSATFEKSQAQRAQLDRDLSTALFELKDAVKPNGLIDKSTGSGAGQLVDIGARAFGIATEGDIAIGKLKPIADLVLKMVPRFEGPQSDKDTQSYREAAGQLADPGMPREVRKAAANTIIRLMENRKGQFVTTDMAAEGTTTGGGASAPAPMYATNPQTKERIMSTDGGVTWNPAR